MNEKKLSPEGSYISDFQIQKGKQTLLEAYQSGNAERERSLLLLLQKDALGSGDALGKEQLSELLLAASSAVELPQFIILMDKAVLLACSGNAALGSLCRMEAMGTQILLCSRAAEKYACELELCCGEKADEVQLWSVISKADRVITL